jgi:hypothetical protein
MRIAIALAAAVLGLAAGVFAGELVREGSTDAGAARIAAVLGVALAATLCASARGSVAPWRLTGPLLWAMAWGALAGIAAATIPGPASATPLFGLAAAAAALVFALERAHAALARRCGPAAASIAVLAFAVPATAAPLWLGPLSLDPALGPAAAAVALWIGPLGYLASAAGIDVLRSAWLYANSPLGNVHYDYPDPFIFASILVVLGAAFWIAPTLFPTAGKSR